MNQRDFVKYFKEFYGPGGLYAFDFKFKDDDVVRCIRVRGKQFEGDSFDREAIRDMLLVANNRAGGVAGGGL